MKVCLIQVPYMAGDERHPASKGPQRFMEAGADRRLAAKGIAAGAVRVDRGTPFRDSASASLAVCKRLALEVQRAVADGALPLVLAGSCDASKGILSGFDHGRCGIVWLDAHGDFNTPESTITGFFPGMSLALILGHCYQDYWAQIGNSAPIAESATLLLGVRDLDPAERERLTRSAVQQVSWNDGKPQADVQEALEKLASRTREVYLHIDVDVLDPKVGPGVADHPVPGGLSLPDMEGIIRAVGARFRIRAAAVATYNPDRDEDEKTLHACLRIIELIAESVIPVPR